MSVDESIWILELMKEYWQPYDYFAKEIDSDIYELMKWKLISERKVQKKQVKNKK